MTKRAVEKICKSRNKTDAKREISNIYDRKRSAVSSWIMLFTAIILISTCIGLIYCAATVWFNKDYYARSIEKVIDPAETLVDPSRVLSSEERMEIISYVRQNKSPFSLYFVSGEFKGENKVYTAIQDEFASSKAKSSSIFPSERCPVMVLAYDTYNGKLYIGASNALIKAPSKLFEAMDFSNVSTGQYFVKQEGIALITEYYAPVLKSEKPIVEIYKELYDDMRLNLFSAEDLAAKREEVNKNEREENTVLSGVGIVLAAVVIFFVVLFTVDKIEIEFYSKAENRAKELADKYFDKLWAEEEERNKKSREEKEAKKEEEKKRKEKEEALWAEKNPTNSLIEMLQMIASPNEALEKEKEALVKKLSLVGSIFQERGEDESTKKFMEPYVRLYFPAMKNALEKVIDNAKVYQTSFAGEDEYKILHKTYKAYTEMCGYIIKHSNDTVVDATEADIDAIISMAKMHGILK